MCLLPVVLAAGCAKTVTVLPSSYSDLEGTVLAHGLRITTTDGETYYVARARAVGDSIEVLELTSRYDERNEDPKPEVPFAIPRERIVSVEEVHVRSKSSLAIFFGVTAALLAGLGWIVTQAGGGSGSR